MEIRREEPGDLSAVAEVLTAAFGGTDEARLVEALRRSSRFLPDLSLVAVSQGRVVGHILFTRLFVKSATSSVPGLALAPMAVVPSLQRRGIGSLLVEQGLEQCKRLGERLVIVVGHPEYYPRFGFVRARPRGIQCPFDAPDEAFLALELERGALEGVSGVVEYAPEFSTR